MQPTARDAILNRLEAQHVRYRHLVHPPTRTSADAAAVRGVSMRIGGKSLLLKAGDRFVLVVISAALQVHSRALRRALHVGKLRFATCDELHERTGLVPGCVPPFGTPILPLPLYVDQSVLANERIAFNCGLLTESVIMSIADYRRIADIEAVINVSANDASDQDAPAEP
jgi:Ala-tRNA(Pro) deacylase